jgi:hypothetical protein
MTDNPFKIDIEVALNNTAMTPYAGLFPFFQMCDAMKLPEVINKALHVRSNKGYEDFEHVFSIAAMQFVGGETVDGLDVLKNHFDPTGLSFRIPSPSATREYLKNFHNAEEEVHQKQGRVYIPEENEFLSGFAAIHTYIFHQAYNTAAPVKVLTLDQDATFIETNNEKALYNYQKEKSYEAFNTYCPEYDIVVGTQFRDGNVNPGYGQLEELRRVLSGVPEGVEKIKLRSDTAGYQIDLLKYCAEGRDERFKVIEFAISCPVTRDIEKAAQAVPAEDWKPVTKEVTRNGVKIREKTGQEWAEIVYMPDSLGNKLNEAEYRFIATRESAKELIERGDLPGSFQLKIPEVIEEMEKNNPALRKLHMMEMAGEVYKVFCMVTDMTEEDGGAIVEWQHGRCGKSEEIHHVLKKELGGGHVVSGRFGANAAWWNIAVLTLSLLNLFKRNFLPEGKRKRRPKGLRYEFFVMMGRFVNHARKKILRVYAVTEEVAKCFQYARDRLMSFCTAAG